LVHLGLAASAPCAPLRKAFGTHPRHYVAIFQQRLETNSDDAQSRLV
jgi:hypothetical protein